MNIEPKTVTFSWTENDWLEAQRQIVFCGQGTQQFIKNIVYWAVVILILQLVWNGMAGHMPAPQSIFEIQIGCLIFYAPLIGGMMLRKRAKRLATCKRMYRLTPERFIDQSFGIDDCGLSYRQQYHSYSLPWKVIHTVFLTRDFLVMVNIDYGPNILPRRAFSDGGKAWYDAVSEYTKGKKAV